MDRSKVPPQELQGLVSELLRQLRAEGVEIKLGSAVDAAERVAVDQLRKRRDEEAIKRDAEARRKRTAGALLEAVLPPRVHEFVTGETVVQTAAGQAATKWIAGAGPRACILRGPVGVGKTAAAGLAVRCALERGMRSVSWHRPNDFVSAILHAYDDEAPRIGTDLVVVDDMGRETKTDFEEALTTFLDSRRGRLLITTNIISAEQMRARYDVRLIERLNEQALEITVKGPSMRQPPGNRR